MDLFFRASGFRPPPSLGYGFFSRLGGVSTGVYASLNCGLGSADAAGNVETNRAIAAEALGASAILGARQEHGCRVAVVTAATSSPPRADALITATPGLALGVLTADCLPILLVRRDGDATIKVAAVHGGWRSLVGGILAATVAELGKGTVTALVGPGISAANYEVDGGFRDRIGGLTDCLTENGEKLCFDLREAATRLLKKEGIADVFHCRRCTFADERFFSRRRSLSLGENDYGGQISIALIKSR